MRQGRQSPLDGSAEHEQLRLEGSRIYPFTRRHSRLTMICFTSPTECARALASPVARLPPPRPASCRIDTSGCCQPAASSDSSRCAIPVALKLLNTTLTNGLYCPQFEKGKGSWKVSRPLSGSSYSSPVLELQHSRSLTDRRRQVSPGC